MRHPGKRIVALGTTEQADERTLAYTNDGVLAHLIDANNNRTTYEYDGHDRLVKTRFPLPTVPVPPGANSSSTTDYEQLTLDPASNVTSRRLRDGQVIGYGYDALNRLTAKDLPAAEPDATYAYDLAGRMTSTSQPGYSTSMGWDALGRMTHEQQGFGRIDWQYDLAGRRTRTTWWDGFYVDYQRDVLGNLTFVRENGATSGVGVLATFYYDDLARRVSLVRGNGAVTYTAYDPVSRLAGMTHDLAATANDLNQAYSYNPASQIASVTRSNDLYAWTGHFNQNDPSTVNGLNQIANVGPKTITHDARGNITAVGTQTYAYTSENMLVAASGGTTLHYDPLLRLVEYNTSVSTRFVYEGAAIAAEVDNPGAIQRRYVRGDGMDELLVEYVGSGTANRRFLSADERGSIIAVTDSAGAVVAINKYDEYGVPQSTNLGRFGYTGQAWLPEVALWYYKARFYNPADGGRFMQTDPIGYEAGPNLYAYVLNDPVNWTDPLGLIGLPNSDGSGCSDNDPIPCDTVNGRRRSVVNWAVFYWGVGSIGGFGGGGSPQKTQQLTKCQRDFIAGQLDARGLPSSHLGDVKFVSGLDANAGDFSQNALSGGAEAVTQGNTIYVQPALFDRYANLRGPSGYEEVVHTAQFALHGGGAAFYLSYGLNSVMGFISGLGGYKGNAYEAFAKGAANVMAKAAPAAGCPR